MFILMLLHDGFGSLESYSKSIINVVVTGIALLDEATLGSTST
jgi:hypothetical protein